MNNKELLPSGSQKKLDGIWEITIGESNNNYGYEDNLFGDLKFLDPSKTITTTAETVPFTESMVDCISSTNPNLTIGDVIRFELSYLMEPFSVYSYLWFHLKATEGIRSWQLPVNKNSSTFNMYFSTNPITGEKRFPLGFSENNMPIRASDLGKTYRMYIGPLDTPPPWL